MNTTLVTRLVDLGLDALAAKRMTRLMVDDALLSEAREAFWKRYPPESAKLGYLLTCHACTSMWAAALVRSPSLPRQVRDLFALSEMVLALQRMVDD